MPRNSRATIQRLHSYALPIGTHKVIKNAAYVFADLMTDDYRKIISSGHKPRYTVAIYDVSNQFVTQDTEVVVTSIREHTVRDPYEVSVGNVIEIFGQIYKPGYHARMIDVCMIYFSGYREGIIVPIDPKKTILDFANLKWFNNASAVKWMR